jgi:hypothetical protein
MSSNDGTPGHGPGGITPRSTQREPSGPRKILRGGKLETVPAEPGFYEQSLKSTVRGGTTSTSRSEMNTNIKGQLNISESERIIEESSSSLKHLGEDDTVTVTSKTKKPRGGEYTDTSDFLTRSQVRDDKSTSKNVHTSQSTSSTIDERSSTSNFIDNVTDITTTNTTIVRPGPRPTQVRGSNFETMSSGTIHDYGDVQGITVVSQSKTVMDQTVDQRQAQAELEKLTTSSTVYGVDIESTLSRSRVKAVHEKEISSGTVRIGDSGVETTENVVKSVTEIKTARVSSGTTKDSVEIDEKVLSSTTSTDRQTFRFDEITDSQASKTLTNVRRRNDVMNFPGTTTAIDYTENYKDELNSSKVLKTGQVLVEELYDTKTSFESMDRDRVKSRAIQDENMKTTTILEKSEDTLKAVDQQSYVVGPRTTPIRQPSNLKSEGVVDYESTNRRDYNEKTTDRVKAVRRNTYTKTEGDMYLQTTNKTQFTEQVGDRYDAKKPKDQIQTPEGQFDMLFCIILDLCSRVGMKKPLV